MSLYFTSNRFSMFASLFDEITAGSFTATQALNPGFFFKEAADYANKRKISAYEICQVCNSKQFYVYSRASVIYAPISISTNIFQ